MGYLGLGSTITMMGMRYGDEASVAFTEEVTKQLALVGWLYYVTTGFEEVSELFAQDVPPAFFPRLTPSPRRSSACTALG